MPVTMPGFTRRAVRMWRYRIFWRFFGLCFAVWFAIVGLLVVLRETLASRPALLGAGAVVAALAALVFAWWLTRRIGRPLRDLTNATDKIAHGKFGHKIYAAQGDEVGALAQAFNQMSERLAEQFAELEEDRQQLRTILSGMVEGVIALDGGQRILFANERASQLLDFHSQNAIGRKLWEVVRLRALQEALRRALAGPGPAQEEVSVSGTTERILTVHAARLPGGPERGAVLVLHDTSDVRRLERIRQEFVANVSHELKTPLSVIKACVETLLDGAVEDPSHRGPFLERIAEQGERLHTLILDLLSLARIESGEEVFEFRSVALEPVVSACLERHRARAEAKHQLLVAFPPVDETGKKGEGEKGREGDRESAGEGNHTNDSEFSPSPFLPVSLSSSVWADEEAVGEILDNLVDNAVKYTPEEGKIAIRWRADGDQICLEVEDSGIGIPERDLPRIFERFYRVDKARSRELGGTGLGLSIVKHLVQAMNGNILARSQVGTGTVFTVRLPRSAAA